MHFESQYSIDLKMPNYSPSYLRGCGGLGMSSLTEEGATSPPFLEREKRKTRGTIGQSVSPLCLAR